MWGFRFSEGNHSNYKAQTQPSSQVGNTTSPLQRMLTVSEEDDDL